MSVKMKKLIINADDLGLSNEVDIAAVRALSAGRITDVSVIACGRSFDNACALLEQTGRPGAGVHLTLTGGFSPCSSSAVTLTTQNGTFTDSYFSFARKYFAQKLDMDDIRRELASQITKARAKGLNITHLDSHQHVHVFPGVLDIVLSLAEEFNVPYVRSPLEPLCIMRHDFRTADLTRHMMLKAFALKASQVMDKRGLTHNRAFMGHFHAGRITERIMTGMLCSLPEGVTEIAVHPAVVTAPFLREYPWFLDSGREFHALMSGEWWRKIDTCDIELLSHGQVR